VVVCVHVQSTVWFTCSYRTREQIQEVRTKRDPITGFKDRVIACELMTAEEIKVCFHLFTVTPGSKLPKSISQNFAVFFALFLHENTEIYYILQ